MDFEPVVTFPLVKFGMFKTQSIVILFYLQVTILQRQTETSLTHIIYFSSHFIISLIIFEFNFEFA